MSMPTRGMASGTMRATTMVTTMGKSTFSFLLTGRSCFMVMARSSLVVRAFMTGGWITGTRAI